MTSGLKLSTAAIALLTVVGLGTAPASAADLGGDCCADLEERIAELEATTARKGNRKVSLEISGHVNETLIFWDDGFEQNSGVYTNDNSRSRFRFKGSAAIADGVKAGYLLEIGVRSANSKRFTQDDPNPAADAGLDVRHSAWFVESKSLGTVWLGRTGPAAEGITEINLANTKDVAKLADMEDSALGLFVRTPTGGTTNLQFRRAIRDVGDQPGETERGQIVKYVSPAFEGFSASAAWGADDYWDIGLNYKGEFAGFQLVAGIAYGEETSQNAPTDTDDYQISNCRMVDDNDNFECQQVGGSASIMHEDTGLYMTLSAGWSNSDAPEFNNGGASDYGGWLTAKAPSTRSRQAYSRSSSRSVRRRSSASITTLTAVPQIAPCRSMVSPPAVGFSAQNLKFMVVASFRKSAPLRCFFTSTTAMSKLISRSPTLQVAQL